MKSTRTVFLLLLALAIVGGCSKKTAPVTITEWAHYQDPYYKLAFNHPAGWQISSNDGGVKVYSSKEAAEKFFDPYAVNKPDGVELIVARVKMDTVKTLEGFIKEFSDEKKASGFNVKAAEPKKLENLDGQMITFSGAYTKENKVSSIRVIAMADSVMYYIQYSAFGDLFEANKVVFDTLLASVRLPKPKSAAEMADPLLPSADFEQFDNVAFKFSYPSNFDVGMGKKKGEASMALDIKGGRQDCAIHIDLLPSKGLTVEKVFEQNEKFYKAGGKGSTTIDGQKAMYLTYVPAKDIEARAYFIVKGDKWVRVIMNYYTPKKADYLPAFEKVVGSLKIK